MTWRQSLLIALAPAVVSGVVSYLLAIRKSAKEIEQMTEKHKQEMETLREQYKLEIEKIQVQQEHEKKIKEQEAGVKIGGEILSSLMTGIMGSEAMKKGIDEMVSKKFDTKEDKSKNAD